MPKQPRPHNAAGATPQPSDEAPASASVADLLGQIQAEQAGAREAWASLRARMLRRRTEMYAEAMQARPALAPAPPIPDPPPLPPYLPPAPVAPEAAPPAPEPAPTAPAQDPFAAYRAEFGPPPDIPPPSEAPVTLPAPPAELGPPNAASDAGSDPDEEDFPAAIAALPTDLALADFEAFLSDLQDAPPAPPPSLEPSAPVAPATDLLADVDAFIQSVQALSEPPAPPSIEPPTSEPDDDPFLAALISFTTQAEAAAPPPAMPDVTTPITPEPPAAPALPVLPQMTSSDTDVEAFISQVQAVPTAPAPPDLPSADLLALLGDEPDLLEALYADAAPAAPLPPNLTDDIQQAFARFDQDDQRTHPLVVASSASTSEPDVLAETEALIAQLHAELGLAAAPAPAPTAPAHTTLHPNIVPRAPLLGSRLEHIIHPTSAPLRHLKRVGNTTYVHLCRVGLGVRDLLTSPTDLPESQHQQLSIALLELHQATRVLLAELEQAYRQTDPTERRTLADFVELMGHNMGMLRHELDFTERTAEQQQHFLISTYAGEMHRQITLLLYDLQSAYQTIVMEPWRQILGGNPPNIPPQIAPGVGSSDLTRIAGIGIGIEQRLYQAGIATYARLAQSNVAELRQILGGMAQYVDVGAWIATARRLAG
ncbi:MAG: hypothetical protein HC911_10265 [Chloroflexaceae bacterium]|nr:hypothetical protein [Chloroflexaceae bacterium]